MKREPLETRYSGYGIEGNHSADVHDWQALVLKCCRMNKVDAGSKRALFGASQKRKQC